MIGVKLPSLGQNKQSAADMIVNVLTTHWPLSAKKIYNRIKQEYQFGSTYQAVHKSLKHLQKEGILLKQGKDYQINLKWLDKIVGFANNVRKNYLAKEDKTFSSNIPNIATSGNASILTFNTIKDADLFVINFERRTNKTAVGHARHFWWALFYLKKTFDKHLIGINKKTYGLCRGATALDKWCVEFENSIGLSSKCGIDVAQDCDLYVYDDYVIHVFMPLELVKKIDELFENSTRILDINFRKLFDEIYEKKTTVQVIMNKNPQLAGRVRKETIVHFSAKS